MPSLQVVDLGDQGYKKRKGIGGFMDEVQDAYKGHQERSAIDEILGEYKQNMGEAQAYEKAQLNLMQDNRIGPTKRLEIQSQLDQVQKTVIQKDKALNAQYKAVTKAQEKEQQKVKSREALEKAGATQQQIDLYEAASVGGETKIMGDILEDVARNKAPEGLVPKGIEDKDKGLTPKERVARQDDRFKLQTPLVNKNSDALKAAESEGRSIELLKELDASGKVGEGIHNLNINPIDGSLIIPKAATAEEQLFVKTVNDFTVKAKDSFGARVTNFELDRFMQRLPTLANSQEGRALILRQMGIINSLNQLEHQALQDVFDEYGVRNIDYADAETIARQKIAPQKDALRAEFLTIEKVAKKEDMDAQNHAKSKVKEGYTGMIKPDGTMAQFPTKNVPNLLEKGYKKL